MDTLTTLEAKDLGCIRQDKTIFAGVSFQLTAGQALIIEGENGAGKSSLLRLLAGLATPAAGKIVINGKNKAATLTNYVEHMHYLGHNNGIRLGLTVEENLKLACELAQTPPTQIPSVLAALQLSKHEHIQTQYLSAGQKRRVALARLLLMPRTLWILDEPLTALDTATQELCLDTIDTHLQNGGMCIMTSHQPIAISQPSQYLRMAAC